MQNPPEADSTQGDQTVLLASAALGINTVTIPNAEHDNLPEDGKEEVLFALGLDGSGEHVPYDKHESFLGFTILSPIIPTITDPSGNEFVCDATHEESGFACVVDETNPNGPKLLVIADPAEGQYSVTLTGTGDGEYHAITCFADTDENACTTREGQTSLGQVDTYAVEITPDSYEAPVGDIVQTICAMPALAKRQLHGQAVSLCRHAEKWEKEYNKRGSDAKQTMHWKEMVEEAFARFSDRLDEQIEQGSLEGTAALELLALRDNVPL